ncbi:ArsR/SmtB family transcription factor [Aquidulcibacter sp.]|jgi:ArsR family transcriptional regulator|uniref:ArsR/SmtB family transcription factor n=1 Tax=Aquidulcibacter sp. TaxID=2052990 RepID=UPI0037C15E68
MEQNIAIKMLSAIAHEGRLSLVRRLIQAGPQGMPAGDLARFAQIGPTTASAQLLVLTNANLVKSTRNGREVIYCACYDRFSELMQFLMHDCCGKRPEIVQLLDDEISA